VPVCPKEVLYLSEEVDRRGVHLVRVREEAECVGCTNCAIMCPDAALEVEE
jgi:2-oxoglutarate ferredoxin oxidoreductase subunit delta